MRGQGRSAPSPPADPARTADVPGAVSGAPRELGSRAAATKCPLGASSGDTSSCCGMGAPGAAMLQAGKALGQPRCEHSGFRPGGTVHIADGTCPACLLARGAVAFIRFFVNRGRAAGDATAVPCRCCSVPRAPVTRERGREAAPKGTASNRSAQPPAPCCESQLCSLAALVAADMALCDAPCKGAIRTILSNGFSPPCNSANELFPGSGLNLSAPGSGEVLPAVTCKAKPSE